MDQEPWHSVSSGREKIISGIGTPLGFFVLALLIVEAFLWGAGWGFNLPVEIRERALWAGLGMFLLVLITVVILVIFFPKNLVFSERSHLTAMKIYGEKDRPVSELIINQTPLVPAPADRTPLAQITATKNTGGGEQNE